VFQSALKEFASSTPCTPRRSTPCTPRLDTLNQIYNEHKSLNYKASNSTSENMTPNNHPNLSRVMSDNNIILNAVKERRSGSNPSVELRRLYHKKNETGDKKTNNDSRNILKTKGIHGYSTNDLISYARHQPILSQKSYETLSKSQADLFRITAV
jgi:hypothetical protein